MTVTAEVPGTTALAFTSNPILVSDTEGEPGSHGIPLGGLRAAFPHTLSSDVDSTRCELGTHAPLSSGRIDSIRTGCQIGDVSPFVKERSRKDRKTIKPGGAFISRSDHPRPKSPRSISIASGSSCTSAFLA